MALTMPGRSYILPAMVATRYVFNRVIRETEDTIVYGAVQRDIQRDIIVETLRPELMEHPSKVQSFLETARLQANAEDASMGCSLELFFADDTWHHARESIRGESLDTLLQAGGRLSATALCELMIQLCRTCLYMDILGADNTPFSLNSVYATGNSFRYDNPTVAGHRSRAASGRFLSSAARELLALLDEESPLAGEVRRLMEKICFITNWTPLEPLLLDESLVHLRLKYRKDDILK